MVSTSRHREPRRRSYDFDEATLFDRRLGGSATSSPDVRGHPATLCGLGKRRLSARGALSSLLFASRRRQVALAGVKP